VKVLYVQMMDLYLIFEFFKGRCDGNQIMLSTPTDTTCIRCTSARKRLQYHGLAVRVNSGDDVAISYKNLVNICLITPEMTRLICVCLVGTTRPKTGEYS